MRLSAILPSQSVPDRTFSRWLNPSIPSSLVEVDVSFAPANSFSATLIQEGWGALLLEANPIFQAHLSEKWKAIAQVQCRGLSASLPSVSVPEARLIADVLTESGIPAEFGLLILNRLERRLPIIEHLHASGFRPWLIALKDDGEPSEQRSAIYMPLSAKGYLFAGTEQEFSLWTRLSSMVQTPSSPLHTIPGMVQAEGAKAFFDTPTSESRFSLAGHIELKVSGWAFLEEQQPTSSLVYVEMLDLRTGRVEYVPATRFPRLDVARHFDNPALLMSGFQANVPLEALHPNGLRLRVVQCTDQKIYLSSAEITIDRGLENFELTARQGLAKKFLRGSGVEIGALQKKLELPPTCKVRYVDRMSIPDLLDHYPEFKNVPLQAPDIVDNGERLGKISANSLDFVVANHFFEHSENPIQTLKNLLRVLRCFGILFMAVPDKRYTFDAERPSTPFDVLRQTYQSGERSDRSALYGEWVELVEMNTGPERDRRAKELMLGGYSIHFNVWSADEIISFLIQAREEFTLPFKISSTVCSDNETIVILERTN